MVELKNITGKNIVERNVHASGKIYLKEDTIRKIRDNDVDKGDVRTVSEIAGINAVKRTQYLIPLCHQLLVENISFNYEYEKDHIVVECFVESEGRTGLEMEALVGVSIALNTIWDMVKYLEKDEDGQYPTTRITDIHVIKKKGV